MWCFGNKINIENEQRNDEKGKEFLSGKVASGRQKTSNNISRHHFDKNVTDYISRRLTRQRTIAFI